ncbi:MAG: hypothetical protein CRN43_10025, partial [Candidatus Nephrothrix sp. EaCA]
KSKGSSIAKNKRAASKISSRGHKKEATKENPSATLAMLEGLLPKKGGKNFLLNLKNNITRHLSEPIIADYIETVKRKKVDLLRLAYKMNGDKIDVWAEIKDRDDKTRKKLYSIYAKVNNRHYPATEIFLDSLIVEERHDFAVPREYREVNLKQ